MPEDAQIAEPSTAPVVEAVEAPPATPEPPAEDLDLSKLSPAEIRQWKKTGDLPKVSKPTKTSDPATDKLAEAAPAEKAEAKPPAEPAAAKPKLSAEDRVQQVLVERARERQEAAQKLQALERELQQLKAGTKPSEPVKATEATGKPKFPNRDNFDTLDAYEKAMVDYSEALTDYKIQEARRTDQERAKVEARKQYEAELSAGWEENVNQALADAGDGSKALEADMIRALQVVQGDPDICEFVMGDPLGPQMAAALGKDLKRAHALLKIESPAKLARELADLKNDVRAGKTPAPKPAPSLPPPPKAEQVSSPPPRELSTAASSTSDIRASLEKRMMDGDSSAFGEWKALENATAIAARSRR